MSKIINTINEWKDWFSRENIDKAKSQIYIWNNINYIRTYRWLSQMQLAESAWTTQRIVSQIENGEYNPSIDILSRIAEVLSVRLEIVIKEKINWRLIEIFDYFIKRFSKVDILKATKLSYFIDLEYQELFKRKFTWLNYYRWNFGPFDERIYILKEIFDKIDENTLKNNHPIKKYVFLWKKEIKFLDNIFDKYWKKTWTQLMKMSYETQPMKKLWATLGGTEKMWEMVL